jgi:hypothetical protein
MSVMTAIQNFRTSRTVSQEKANVEQATQPRARSTGRPFVGVCFALAFVFALAVLASPVAAADTFNLSIITDVIESFIELLTPITDLVIAIVPLWFILEMIGFIMGLLATILAMIKFRHN